MRIKFNEMMLEFFDVPNSNFTHELWLSGGELLNCPVASFSDEEKKFLKSNKDNSLLLFGIGNSEFEIQSHDSDISG